MDENRMPGGPQAPAEAGAPGGLPPALREALQQDMERFAAEYPQVDLLALEGDPDFRAFAGDMLYRVPLVELYRAWTQTRQPQAAPQAPTPIPPQGPVDSRALRSTGGGQGGGMDILTTAQRLNLAEWNRDNPALRMTAKEFMAR